MSDSMKPSQGPSRPVVPQGRHPAHYYIPCFVSSGRFVRCSDIDANWELSSSVLDDDLLCMSLYAAEGVCRRVCELREAAGIEPTEMGLLPLTESGSILYAMSYDGGGPDLLDHFADLTVLSSAPPDLRINAIFDREELKGYFRLFTAEAAARAAKGAGNA